MNVFEFLKGLEIDSLPSDESERFVEFYRHTCSRLERIISTPATLQGLREDHKEAKYTFVNVFAAFARDYDVEGVSNFKIPSFGNFSEDIYRNFKADVEFAVTQMMLSREARKSNESVAIRSNDKDKIRTYLHHIREIVENAEWNPREKSLLLEKLGAFEDQLNARRLSLVAVAMLAMAFVQAPGGVDASWDVVNKVYKNIMEIVVNSQAAEKEIKQLSSGSKLSLPQESQKALPQPESYTDEIPF